MKTQIEKINVDACYQDAEQKAADYFQSLQNQLEKKNYVPTLISDFHTWKKSHSNSFFSRLLRGNRKPEEHDYHSYIRWMKYTGKLDTYLDRSFSYVFMRDLGKDIHDTKTKERLSKIVTDVKTHLIESTAKERPGKPAMFNLASLYRLAQKDGVEETMIWVLNKINSVSSNLPEKLQPEHAKRKLIKLIAGVVMQEIEEMDKNVSSEERTKRLDKAIRLGYSYGLTYPFIDDLLDAKILSAEEEKQYSSLIRTTLTTGIVPDLGEWSGENRDLIQYIHSELKEAFEYIKANQKQGNMTAFLEQSFIFYQSQEVDRNKDISNPNYTNEELFIPIILKSSSSRLIVRSVISATNDEEINNRLFYYGIYNQLADDFTDMFDDMEEGSVTPYTYYWKYHDTRPDLFNPFELYWTVISYLLHNVYQDDSKIRELILSRAVNSLKRFKQKRGTETYNQVMGKLTKDFPKLNKIIQEAVRKADDVDFFDKLLRDHIISNLKRDREERDEFKEELRDVRRQINSILTIEKGPEERSVKEPIIEAANYSVSGEAKRLRPIVVWFIGVKEYGLEKEAITPLLKSLEYMHTASLIFDDLPAQDNALLRRGRPTLHQVYSTAIAELTGLFLTQKAIEEQSTLNRFDAEKVLQLIQYTSRKTEDMCKGQAMDLESKGKTLSIEELSKLCFYKTGIAFEVSLIMPAILANRKESEMNVLKKIAYHSGIAFQIKDDLLDVEGNEKELGKMTGKDADNRSSTFVSVLGLEGAKKAMWEHYCLAIETLQELPRPISFLKHLLDYVVNREK